jgi:glyoxylase I family protein
MLEHRASSGQPFDETRTGLDHLAFEVPTRDDLEEWIHRLDERGVTFSPIAASHSIPGAEVVVLRDPLTSSRVEVLPSRP